MRTKLTTLLAAVVLGLAACGQGDVDKAGKEAGNQAEKAGNDVQKAADDAKQEAEKAKNDAEDAVNGN